MTQRELAKVLGISPGQVVWCKKRGMPIDNVEAAIAWRDAHVAVRTPKQDDLDIALGAESPIEFAIPEGSGPEEILARLQIIERSLAGHLSAWQEKLKRNPTNVIASKLTLLRKEHREASKACALYEKIILDLGVKRGQLASTEACDAYTLAIVAPIIASALPRSGQDEGERSLLARIAKELLAEISSTSAMAARAAA
jgi:hypothetical protein